MEETMLFSRIMRWESLTAAVLLLGFAAVPQQAIAAAEEAGIITAVNVDVRAEPKDKGKSKLKVSHGRKIAAIGHSPDGKWVQIKAEVDRAGETATFEGWIEKKYVRSISRYGFSWERKDGPAGGGDTMTAGGGEWGGDTATGGDTGTAAAGGGGDDWGAGGGATEGDAGAGASAGAGATGGDDWGSGASGTGTGDAGAGAGTTGGDDWGSGDTGSSSSGSSGESGGADDGW